MHILIISPTFPPNHCGIGDATWHLIRELVDIGVKVTVVTKADKEIFNLYNSGEKSFDLLPCMKDWSFASFPSLLDVVEKVKPDIIHIQYETHLFGLHNWAACFFPQRLRKRNIKVVTTIHELIGPYFPILSRYNWFRKLSSYFAINRIIKGTDHLIITNEGYLETIRKEHGLANEHSSLIYQSSTLPLAARSGFNRASARAEMGIAPDCVVLGYLGFFREDKGLDNLVRAYKTLKVKYPNIVLQLIGEDQGKFKFSIIVNDLAKELGIEKDILWNCYLPPHEAVERLLCSDIVVLPYLDGLSVRRTSFLTAIAHCLPVVSTTAPDLPKMVRESVVLAAPTPEGLISALWPMVNREQTRIEFQAKSEYLATFFSWKKSAENTLEVYKKVL